MLGCCLQSQAIAWRRAERGVSAGGCAIGNQLGHAAIIGERRKTERARKKEGTKEGRKEREAKDRWGGGFVPRQGLGHSACSRGVPPPVTAHGSGGAAVAGDTCVVRTV